MQNLSEQLKYDPWEIKQEIADIKIELHCSRYWLLSEWECNDLSLPFWRIYHSRLGGSFVRLNNREVELTNDILLLIPPYTAFSSRITLQDIYKEQIKGVKISNEKQLEYYKKAGLVDQLFVHFNLGFPYDRANPDVYVCKLNDYSKNIVSSIENNLLNSPNTINFYESMQINSLIMYALQLPMPNMWNLVVPDKRITKVISYIDKNIETELLNTNLSNIASMATNSFARLFKNSMQITLQQYILQKRIEKAILLFHHSTLEIDEIANECGFYDRHYFTNVFKKQTGFSPAKYRRRIFQ
jgi:AraC-like DNA-binding protein